jgi:hypothetical protein
MIRTLTTTNLKENKMYATQYEEHIAHSASCNSRWDGFDRGDANDVVETPTERCIGRMTNAAGQRITIIETDFGTDKEFAVYVDGSKVFADFDCRVRAIQVARWWMDGCLA